MSDRISLFLTTACDRRVDIQGMGFLRFANLEYEISLFGGRIIDLAACPLHQNKALSHHSSDHNEQFILHSLSLI